MRSAFQKLRCMRRTYWALPAFTSLMLAGCFRAPNPSQPSQTPNAHVPQPSAPPATPLPSPISVSPPVITPTPGASPLAATAPRISQPVVRLQPDAAPQILAISLSETTVQPGDRVSASVVTSSNVASVIARIAGYAIRFSKVGVGRFALKYTVGPLPWFIRGTFTMRVIARNTQGAAVERAIPLHVR